MQSVFSYKKQVDGFSTDVGVPGALNFWTEVRDNVDSLKGFNSISENATGSGRIGKRLYITGMLIWVFCHKAAGASGPERIRFILLKEHTVDGKHIEGGDATDTVICDLPLGLVGGPQAIENCHQRTAGKKYKVIKEWTWLMADSSVDTTFRQKRIKLALSSKQEYALTTNNSDRKNRYSLWYTVDRVFTATNFLRVTWCTFFADQLS